MITIILHLSVLPDHDVVRVPVPYPQYEGGDAVASAGQGEGLNGATLRLLNIN